MQEPPYAWLKRNFNDVAVSNAGAKVITELPDVYALKEIPFQFGRRLQVTPVPLIAEGSTPEESAHNLHMAVLNLLEECGELNLLCIKAGQDKSMIKQGEIYGCVPQDDPAHVHDTPALIDMEIMRLSRRNGDIYKAPFAEEHIHLAPEFSL